jgi:hypothetical protein
MCSGFYTMKPKLPNEVLCALAECGRGPGSNSRSREIRRFNLLGRFGDGCTLYVIPARLWAYRRIERQAQAWRAKQERA